jgi:hypothetical protein
MIARPDGPDGCMSCVMVGAESLCQECDHANGYELNRTTLTCYEKAIASDDQWIADCNDDLVDNCDICRAKEYVDHDTNEILEHQFCDICKTGFMKTNLGMCVDSSMVNEPCNDMMY